MQTAGRYPYASPPSSQYLSSIHPHAREIQDLVNCMQRLKEFFAIADFKNPKELHQLLVSYNPVKKIMPGLYAAVLKAQTTKQSAKLKMDIKTPSGIQTCHITVDTKNCSLAPLPQPQADHSQPGPPRSGLFYQSGPSQPVPSHPVSRVVKRKRTSQSQLSSPESHSSPPALMRSDASSIASMRVPSVGSSTSSDHTRERHGIPNVSPAKRARHE